MAITIMRELVNKGELEKFFANVGSLMKQEEGPSQLPDLKHLKRFFLSINSRVDDCRKETTATRS